MARPILRIGTLAFIALLVLSACTGGTQQTGSAPPASDGDGDGDGGEAVEIRWFCCVGAGDDPEQVEVEQQVVDEFNASHDNIELVLEVVEYEEAFDAMAVEIAGGNAPDIVGPAGISGAEAFHGQWLDLDPLIESTGYDLSQFAEGSVDFYRSEENGLEGLPFAIFPSMLYYQRDMFDEAELDYPPHEYGATYTLDGEERDWDFDTLRELALRLTVDENNNDATSADFDPENIAQWGYEPQYQDLRAVGSYFGAGSLVADDGTTAQIPEPWQEAWTWHYENVWEHHVTMNEAQSESAELGAEGNPFQSGNVAMALTHLWYTCCVTPEGEEENANWDIAAVPSHNGTVTANFNADTFRIHEDTKHPEEAFEVLTYLLGDASDTLLQLYGGFPGREEDQEAFFAGLDERFPQGVDWPVAVAGIEYADNPSFEGFVPNYQETFDAIQEFGSTLRSSDGLDIDAEIEGFREELQAIFDRAE